MTKIVTVILLILLSFQAQAKVYPGIDVLLQQQIHLLKGKRVGLITNATGVNHQMKASVDLLKSHPEVNLTALFAPEHGIRGDLKAGEHVAGGKDPKTGLPVYSLYGANDHKPQKVHLAKVDILVYDIQDVGSRAYTYIWSLAEAMKAAGMAGKEVMVLDRPNVYGANVVDGPAVDKKNISFIGLYPIPRVYGMTVGELARLLNVEYRLNCKLTIIPMAGYKRGMSWADTGLQWVPPSPNIPTVASAQCFAATGAIGNAGGLDMGLWNNLPFQTVAMHYLNAAHMAKTMNSLHLPGVIFRPIHYIPRFGSYKGQKLQGVQIHVSDGAEFRPATTEVALLWYVERFYGKKGAKKYTWNKWKNKGYALYVDKAFGRSYVRKALQRGESYRRIAYSWKSDVDAFKKQRKKYLIYR